ncbi:lethal(2)neighbour of tid protein 2 [Galleria mellonella]|uniref:dolichyl-P-Man:Man5GlcNAc2-PP-dolichol alpha-1,3-mannosyltransferase n=1 Tax=Galleria mellonella TaxID=7137 RepID=A0A6J3CDD9_GALME|nr:lethal(2)neighbour of tid protein 2 [Galleria mellonella]
MGNRNKIYEMFQTIRKKLTWSYAVSLVMNPIQLPVAAFLIIVAELIINILVVERVPYTEIDWKAYMQECEGFLNGTLDYSKLRGDTGPLVYPAGFVYIYSFFYFLTNYGENIRLAQYIFIGIYLLQLLLVLRIYIKTRKVPPYVFLISILTSYRIHSIYVLRLFNDPIAVLMLYVSLNSFLDGKWYLGSIFYSLGVSVKMNILLYAPALFFFYLINLGLKDTVKQLFICGIIQLVLGLPFIISNPIAYLKGSFDVGRVFNHTWTVNFRFLNVETFESKCFHLTLLAIHIVLLIIFLPMCIKYFKSYCRLKYVQKQVQPQIDAKNTESKRRKLNKSKQKFDMKAEAQEKITKEQEDFLNSFEAMLQKSSQKSGKKNTKKPIALEEDTYYNINFDILSQLFILPMFIVNFIGVACARSLHYQFYSWYFHSLPYLLWSCNFTVITRFLLLAVIELCWNTYPSTNLTSALLHICHFFILYGVYKKISSELNVASKVQ